MEEDVKTPTEVKEMIKEKVGTIQDKPLLKKYTPEQILQARVTCDEKEMEIRTMEITLKLLQQDIDEDIAKKMQQIRLRKERNKLEELKFDVKTIKRMILESSRS